MIIGIKNIDVYSTESTHLDLESINQAFNSLMNSSRDYAANVASCEALAALADTHYSQESFGTKVLDTIKAFIKKLIELAKKIWERISSQAEHKSGAFFRASSTKKDVKDNPKPADAPDVKAELKKLTKAIDAAFSKDEDVEITIDLKLPFSDTKIDLITKKLTELINTYHRRTISKLDGILPKLDYMSLLALISNAHYAMADAIVVFVKTVSSVKSDADASSVLQALETINQKPEVVKLVETLRSELNLADNGEPITEQYKNVMLALNLRLSEDIKPLPSEEVIDALFDPQSRDAMMKIDIQVKAGDYIAKDRISTNVKFLNTELSRIASLNTTGLSSDTLDSIMAAVQVVNFHLKATEIFVKLIRDASRTEQLYIEKFLSTQKLLAAAKE